MNTSRRRPARRALLGDAWRLGQILRNLVDNAIKFSERGTIRVQAGLAEEDGFQPAAAHQ